MLAADIRLMVPDGKEYNDHFCPSLKSMIGLKNLFDAYSVEKDYFLFFYYVGRSTFYVSIYNNLGIHIFNDVEVKFIVKDVLQKFEDEVIVLSDSSTGEKFGALNSFVPVSFTVTFFKTIIL